MKITRNKKSHKTLMFYTTHFQYHEPYQVLIDATFCQAALKNKVIIEEQLKKYFQSQVKLLTTQCIILEAESLGPPLTGATQIVKQFFVHKCGHEGKAVTAAECIKQMTKDSRYIVASQDRNLQASLRKVPGRCLLYLHKAAPVLEAPSDASKKWVDKKARNLLPAEAEKKIEFLKKKEGLIANNTDAKAPRKHKGPKNPNPLSCKKSKKEKQMQKSQTKAQHQQPAKEHKFAETSKTPMKPKRKRVKIPAHVKEVLKNKNSS
ncbi:rRNA-processing protein UTP23 homolog [Musca domestica]|uniref:rRNA-processing protein UTP23 homolog n=1 Tax=Musca domestica TaxID=7370 RepID=A0A1I8N8A7_MUSDO|nr:rRNA-processing protein UTP23 homolog [Musca domestica]